MMKTSGAKMSIRKSTWLLIAICFISWCCFAARPKPWLQLVAMASLLVALMWVVALSIQGAIKWREQGLRNLISCSLIVSSLPLALFCGHVIRGAVFSSNLDRWNKAATWVMAHTEPNQGGPIRLPEEYAALANDVHYRNEAPCGLMVDFFWGSGFPVRHTVRRYATNREWMNIGQCWRGWRSGRALSGDWYEVSG